MSPETTDKDTKKDGKDGNDGSNPSNGLTSQGKDNTGSQNPSTQAKPEEGKKESPPKGDTNGDTQSD